MTKINHTPRWILYGRSPIDLMEDLPLSSSAPRIEIGPNMRAKNTSYYTDLYIQYRKENPEAKDYTYKKLRQNISNLLFSLVFCHRNSTKFKQSSRSNGKKMYSSL
jgi:hypothetical protein